MLRKDVAPEVAPCNRAAWWVWARCVTQWRVGPGGVVGIDLVAVQTVAELAGYWDLELLEKVQVMEAEQLGIWQEAQRSVHRGGVGR